LVFFKNFTRAKRIIPAGSFPRRIKVADELAAES
jgi:hypothetical protein